eukprot:SAG31_NODE_2746_length_5147_cov_15.864303_2_plen_105_part_00
MSSTSLSDMIADMRRFSAAAPVRRSARFSSPVENDSTQRAESMQRPRGKKGLAVSTADSCSVHQLDDLAAKQPEADGTSGTSTKAFIDLPHATHAGQTAIDPQS